MDVTPSQRHCWIVAPLLDTGMGAAQVQELLFRLAFHATVCDAPGDALTLSDLVGDQPPTVRSAWLVMLDRMLTVPHPLDDNAC